MNIDEIRLISDLKYLGNRTSSFPDKNDQEICEYLHVGFRNIISVEKKHYSKLCL